MSSWYWFNIQILYLSSNPWVSWSRLLDFYSKPWKFSPNSRLLLQISISTLNPGFLLQIPDFYSKSQISIPIPDFYSESGISTPNPRFLLQILDFYSKSWISTPNLGFLLQIREFYFNWEDFYSKSRFSAPNSEFILKIPEVSLQNYFKYNLFVCLGFCLCVWNL